MSLSNVSCNCAARDADENLILETGVGDGTMNLVRDELRFRKPIPDIPSSTLTKEALDTKMSQQSSSSSYILANDQSQFSRDIETWMNGGNVNVNAVAPTTTSTENIGVQSGRAPVAQRSVLATSTSIDSGFWYILTMILPLFSVHAYPQWRCTPSLVLNTAELFVSHIVRACRSVRTHFRSVRTHVRQLAQDNLARELFATAMDIILVIYAIGFLILSLYQASLFA